MNGQAAPAQTLRAALPKRPAARAVMGVAALGVLVALFTGSSWLSLGDAALAITLFNLMAMAQAWNLIGGYATALLLMHTGVPVALAVVMAALLTAGIGALAAIPLLRLRGVYFSVGTLGVMIAAQNWMINWHWAGQTRGVILPQNGVLSFDTQYFMGAALLVGTTLIVWLAVRSRFGLRLMAVRDDESAASELGVNGFRVKLAAFTVSAFLVGLCGALNAFQQLTLEPYSAFNISWAINMILACVIGGLATIVGPLIGAAIIFELQQQLQGYENLTSLIEGAILLAVIRFAPGGIWGLLRQLPELVGAWVRSANRVGRKPAR